MNSLVQVETDMHGTVLTWATKTESEASVQAAFLALGLVHALLNENGSNQTLRPGA